jgi:hypothetical protein
LSTLDLTKNFENGTLKIALAELPEKMLDAAYEELDQQAELMKGIAQVLVRVKYGYLRDSIRKERGGVGKHWRVVRVRAGGHVAAPMYGKRVVDYAVIVESKYPFMRPAWQQVCGNIEALIRRAVVERVNP